MRYLGLESSCDETAIAIWDSEARRILYEQVLTQVELHSAFGGVVPGIAIREHLRGFPVLLENLQKHFDITTLDALCVTHGPGLIGCLGIGAAYAQSLQLLLKCPLYGVNHLQGHALSLFIEKIQDPAFAIETYCPHLGLLVSGGNTVLFSLERKESRWAFTVLAQTIDDAAGEALDKGAKLLGFPYPGGPYVEACAVNGDPQFTHFPRAFPQEGAWKFSFSGLKTSLRYFLEKMTVVDIEKHRSSICAAYQAAVMDALCRKVEQALRLKPFKSLGLSGGVANNASLRQRFMDIANREGIPLFVPPKAYCGDNAAMIAFAGALCPMPLALNPNRTLDAIV